MNPNCKNCAKRPFLGLTGCLFVCLFVCVFCLCHGVYQPHSWLHNVVYELHHNMTTNQWTLLVSSDIKIHDQVTLAKGKILLVNMTHMVFFFPVYLKPFTACSGLVLPWFCLYFHLCILFGVDTGAVYVNTLIILWYF